MKYQNNQIVELGGCKWKAETYTDNSPELFYKNRVRLTCIEAHGNIYKVGDVVSFANID